MNNPQDGQQELQSHAKVLAQTVEQQAKLISALAGCLCQCFQRGNKLLLCGIIEARLFSQTST